MKKARAFILICSCMVATPAAASVLEGPATFCGYSPIIDLLPGETVTTLQGGIHGGSFRWDGAFGSLIVHGVGWAGRPNADPWSRHLKGTWAALLNENEKENIS